MSNSKMKGLLKGLRYISQIFENDEKESEMQIGYPTDVKHVAHIGWDGPPKNEFKGPQPQAQAQAQAQGCSSAAASPFRHSFEEEASAKSVLSDDSNQRSGRRSISNGLESPEVPKPSRNLFQSEGGGIGGVGLESPSKDKTEKPKRRSAKPKDGSNQTKPIRLVVEPNHESDSSSSSMNHLDLPKRTRRKKSKDTSDGSVRSRSRASSRGQKASTSETKTMTSQSNSFSTVNTNSESEMRWKNKEVEGEVEVEVEVQDKEFT